MASDIDGNDVQLSKRNVKSIMHDINSRISDDAAVRVAYMMENDIKKLTKAARVVAKSDGRETVMEDDIRRALEVHEIMSGGS